MNSLAQILSSRVKAEIFRLLFGLGDRRSHLRELERQSGLSLSTVRQELKQLKKFGLVLEEVDGNRTYYSANKSHPLYPDIHNIVMKTTGFVEVLQHALEKEPIEFAFVFGSIAKGKDQAHSDIDLMVIGDIGLRQLSKCLSGLSKKVGREINPHTFTRAEFLQRKARGEHFISSVLAEPHLFVIGSSNEFAGMG